MNNKRKINSSGNNIPEDDSLSDSSTDRIIERQLSNGIKKNKVTSDSKVNDTTTSTNDPFDNISFTREESNKNIRRFGGEPLDPRLNPISDPYYEDRPWQEIRKEILTLVKRGQDR